jgi:hypothetical protein
MSNIDALEGSKQAAAGAALYEDGKARIKVKG